MTSFNILFMTHFVLNNTTKCYSRLYTSRGLLINRESRISLVQTLTVNFASDLKKFSIRLREQ